MDFDKILDVIVWFNLVELNFASGFLIHIMAEYRSIRLFDVNLPHRGEGRELGAIEPLQFLKEKCFVGTQHVHRRV